MPKQNTIFFQGIGYRQGYHTILISKICSYFEVLCVRKYHSPYL